MVTTVATPGSLLAGFQFQNGHLPVSYNLGMSNAANVALTPLTAGANGGFVWGTTTWAPQVWGSVKLHGGDSTHCRANVGLVCLGLGRIILTSYVRDEEESERSVGN